ncbi:RidA family protein [Flavobacterium sp.]|uniref:RidA family protein n=1 Tax=Flavobacterium sp. TaxID=239 RepID=UPI0025C18BCB|nr:RidA family protein [Flavobacterium sp.]
MKVHFSKDAPKPIGPYSYAVQSGNLLYCSGQTPIKPESMKIEISDVKGQTHRVIKNLRAVLQEAGLTLNNIIKVNVFLTDMENFSGMNEVYALCFGDHRPARSTVAVKGLPYDALVEIECIAEFKNDVK